MTAPNEIEAPGAMSCTISIITVPSCPRLSLPAPNALASTSLGASAGVLRLLQSHHAVGDHRHANARTVDVESVSCCACVEGFVALGERVACGECAVLRALGREYTVDLSEGIDSI